MVMEAHIAHALKLLSKVDLKEIASYILSTYGRVEIPDSEELLPIVRQDKKNKGKRILMALPKESGRPYSTYRSANGISVMLSRFIGLFRHSLHRYPRGCGLLLEGISEVGCRPGDEVFGLPLP